MFDYLSGLNINKEMYSQILGYGQPIAIMIYMLNKDNLTYKIYLLKKIKTNGKKFTYNYIPPLEDKRFSNEEWAKRIINDDGVNLETLYKIINYFTRLSALTAFE